MVTLGDQHYKKDEPRGPRKLNEEASSESAFELILFPFLLSNQQFNKRDYLC